MAEFVEIPLQGDPPFYSQHVSMGGRVYRLDLAWNDRGAAWYLTVADVEGTPLRSGIRLVPNTPLLRASRRPGLPPGELMLTSLASDEMPDREVVGSDVWLAYVEA